MSSGFLRYEAEYDKKQMWHTRQITWMQYQCHADSKKAIKDIEAFWPLEQKAPVKEMSKRQIRNAAKRLEEKLNSKNNG